MALAQDVKFMSSTRKYQAKLARTNTLASCSWKVL